MVVGGVGLGVGLQHDDESLNSTFVLANTRIVSNILNTTNVP